MLISSQSVNKHGHHRQFLFLIGQYLKKSSHLKLPSQMNRNLVGSIYMYGRLCIKFPQSRMKGERHRLSPQPLVVYLHDRESSFLVLTFFVSMYRYCHNHSVCTDTAIITVSMYRYCHNHCQYVQILSSPLWDGISGVMVSGFDCWSGQTNDYK